MSCYKALAAVVCALMACTLSFGQQVIKGIVFDADNREPLANASITDGSQATVSLPDGSFSLRTSYHTIIVSFAGYVTKTLPAGSGSLNIGLQKNNNLLDEVVVTANRDAVRKTQTPVAIATLNSKLIKETKATTIDQLVNKTSGVYMVNLGNEQHAMGIRQPMGTRSLFLYLEDGIPVRTSGVFNHNALMEMNMAAVRSIEIIKGPGSSLYGGEAIGGAVNMITQAPTAIPSLKLATQANNIGYRRADLQAGFTKGKWGFNLSGYYANRRNGFVEFTDFHKAIATARVDYKFSNKTMLENSFTYMDYYSDMTGSVDSSMFANKSFTSQQTFTYRKAKTIRYRSTLKHEWTENSKTTINLVYRDNSLGQNPAYRIRDDYRKVGSSYVGKKDVAHGEINDNSFKSYVVIAQHRQKFSWLNSSLVGGVSLDGSPNIANAHYIKIKKDTIANKYVSYEDKPDSMLVDYKTDIFNFAGFANFEFSPLRNLRIVASLRYDAFNYHFNNFLPASSVSGSADTSSQFSRLSSKIGFTYNFRNNRGIYANYSEGFVPPQVTELYRSVRVPTLDPSTFINYEIGGWIEIIKDKMTADFSVYRMEGKNSIISVRFDDGTFGNANAGATLHKGVELGIKINPTNQFQIRLNGAYSRHEFKNYLERGVKYDGNEMNSAPHWIHNAEFTYRPSFIKGFRIGLEWQKMSEYYMDQANQYKYEGFDVMNARIGYAFKSAEVWVNVINVTDSYYALNASRSNSGSSYTVGEPRNFNIGVSYDFGNWFKKN